MNRKFWDGFCLSVCFLSCLTPCAASLNCRREGEALKLFSLSLWKSRQHRLSIRQYYKPKLWHIHCKLWRNISKLGRDGRSYDVKIISQSNATKDVKGQEHLKSNATISIRVKDQVFQEHLNRHRCDLLSNLSLPNSTYISTEITSPIQTLFKCNHTLNFTTSRNLKNRSCGDYII